MKTVKIFHDWEFIEDGETIDPISVGMVKETGETYYAIFRDFDPTKANQWVVDNVLAKLESPLDVPRKAATRIRDEILEFVGKDTPEFWGLYSAYDHVVLCQLFGLMIELPKGWPYLTLDVKQLHIDCGCPDIPKQDADTEHNALADARYIRQQHEFLVDYRYDQSKKK
jgi:hypothetical protein